MEVEEGVRPVPGGLVHDVLDRMRPLEPFFAPRTVAVIGATDKAGSVGRTVLRNLTGGRFGGEVYPVHPTRGQVQGRMAHRSVRDIPAQVDLAVVVTPAAAVPGVIAECAEAGVPAAIVISAGFREAGPEGEALEREVGRIAGAAGMRVIGPNCLGIMRPSTGLNATFAAGMAEPGRIALLTQSGALFTAILDWSLRERLGFSACVSVGSMVDVGWGDLIDHLGDDPQTDAILVYMESVGDVRGFLSAAREVSLTKPIIVIKPGRTEAAARAAASHTGALTGSDDVLEAALHRVGVLRVHTISELFSMAEVLGRQPLPRGPRLTIVTNAGGPGVLATDALIAGGGQLAELTRQSMGQLDAALPGPWSRANPVDVLGDAGPDRYAHALQVAVDDPGTDGMLVILTPQDMTEPTLIAEHLGQVAARAREAGKPVLASWMGGPAVQGGIDLLNRAQVPTFGYPDAAASAFCAMWRYASDLQALYETPVPVQGDDADREAARRVLEAASGAGSAVLDEHASKELLASYGIPTVPTRVARTEADAVAAARAIGFPVVVKLWSSTLTHKTDVGGVRLGLQGPEEVAEAFRQILQAVSQRAGREHFDGVTVQPMVPKGQGFELIVGSVHDDQFGPVLLFGAGGELVEVTADRALALPPLTTTLARQLMARTRIFRALQGVRGRPPVDLDRLADLLVRFSQIALDQPRIREIEINPLLVGPEGPVALDARVILHPAELSGDALPRPAIRPYPVRHVREVGTRDGVTLRIRPIRPDDEPLITDLHRRLSERSVRQRYLRWMGLDQRTRHARLVRVCFPDYDRELPLVAEVGEGESRQIVGVGRLSRRPRRPQGQFSLVVADDWQGRGVGGTLLRALVDAAEVEGVTELYGYLRADNTVMHRLCTRLGLEVGPTDDPTILRAELQLG